MELFSKHEKEPDVCYISDATTMAGRSASWLKWRLVLQTIHW